MKWTTKVTLYTIAIAILANWTGYHVGKRIADRWYAKHPIVMVTNGPSTTDEVVCANVTGCIYIGSH